MNITKITKPAVVISCSLAIIVCAGCGNINRTESNVDHGLGNVEMEGWSNEKNVLRNVRNVVCGEYDVVFEKDLRKVDACLVQVIRISHRSTGNAIQIFDGCGSIYIDSGKDGFPFHFEYGNMGDKMVFAWRNLRSSDTGWMMVVKNEVGHYRMGDNDEVNNYSNPPIKTLSR